jgi:superfamily I DNA/RNA helicase
MIKTILGPPGCGKTQTNSNLIRNCIEDGIDPDRIACVSFTRKAATESKNRVCNDWGLEEDMLPYFRTLHSIAFLAGGYKSGEVMSGKDLKVIGDELGIAFGRQKSSDIETDFDQLGQAEGDYYLGLYHLGRSLMLSLDDVYQKYGRHTLHWSELRRLVDAYEDYKRLNGKIDFADMIETFVERQVPLDIDALFVDEAQDLSTLQWKMVDILRNTPRIQVFTGDDDQAIMGFQGADVEAFMAATKEKEVLNQSYRVPRDPWLQACNIASRIIGREHKDWMPTAEKGFVQGHQNIWDIPLHEGNWCIMARTNRIASTYANALRDEGWIYSRFGHPSIPTRMYEAIVDWERLCKGSELFIPELRNIYSFMESETEVAHGFGPKSQKMRQFDEEVPINMETAKKSLGLLVNENMRWHEALGKIDDDNRNYILNALKRGENVKNPRITVSTIHSMKGGECDNVVVVPDLSRAAYREYQQNPNTEHRVYYVATTRAKKSLHIMEPSTPEHYLL